MKLRLKNIYFPTVIGKLSEKYNILKIGSVVILEKKSSNKGHDYENHIRDMLKSAKIDGPLTNRNKNDNDRWGLDADMNLYGHTLNIEVKAEPEAVFGSLSARYTLENGLEGLTIDREELGENFYDALVASLKKPENEQKIIQQLKYIRKIDPSSNGKFSLVMSRAAWDKNREAVTKPLYFTDKIPGEIVRNIYTSKGADYIQIGGRGLFHLGKKHKFMPNNLPMFDGTMEYQVRPKAGTHSSDPSKIKFSLNIDLKFSLPSTMPMSPYTIDSEEGIYKLLNAIEKKKSVKGNVPQKVAPQKSQPKATQKPSEPL
jgi:hypothetical protein